MIANSTDTTIEAAKPEALKVLPDGIPGELKKRPQWVFWKYALDSKGRWTKHPYNPRTGRKASSTDLLTWSRFDTVFEAFESGGYDGVGFVFCSGDPYTGVDLDGCRDPVTGEVEAWAAEISALLGGYTELSPSGKGLHVIVKGKAPAPLKLPYIEMYSIERFFTMTGHAAGILKART
jgi:primase-polymerase (primpol)-like protein